MIHILLPAYNEAEALGRLLERIARALGVRPYHVWVVDDGSSDRTARVALDWAERHPLNLIQHDKNQGLGAAWVSGLRRLEPELLSGDVLVTMDADDTQPAELIPRLTEPLAAGRADVAIASRFAPGSRVVGVPFLRRLTSAAARWLFTAAFPIPGVRDYTCGFRAYTAEILARGTARWGILVTETGFASTAEWLLRLAVVSPRVEEVPFVLRYDMKPTPSKMPVGRTIVRALRLLAMARRIRSS